MDYFVEVVYRNSKLEPVSTRVYDQEEYCGLLKNDIMRIISDVEDLVYKATDGKQKHNWNDDTMIAFNSIRHKLLDKSGDIGRLPDTLKEQSEIVEKDDGEAFIEKIFG